VSYRRNLEDQARAAQQRNDWLSYAHFVVEAQKFDESLRSIIECGTPRNSRRNKRESREKSEPAKFT
jgi:hypothetical protein